MINNDTLFENATKVFNHLEFLQNEIEKNNKEISKNEQQLAKLNEYNINLQIAQNYLDLLIKQESNIFIKNINEILNYGIKTIFDDCDYSIEIQIDNDANKAVIYLVYSDENGNKISSDIQQCGGGIKTVIGVLLQIFFIVHYELEPILFVDEGFSQVSSQYLPNLFSVIQEVTKKNGLKLLLVTHDTRILEYADKHYEIQNGTAISLTKNNEYTDI